MNKQVNALEAAIARDEPVAWQVHDERHGWVTVSVPEFHRERGRAMRALYSAATISALVAERDEARADRDFLRDNRNKWQDATTRERNRAEAAGAALATANERIAKLEKALKEFAEPRNWVVNGRFDPHSGNFDGTTFALAALEEQP